MYVEDINNTAKGHTCIITKKNHQILLFDSNIGQIVFNGGNALFIANYLQSHCDQFAYNLGLQTKTKIQISQIKKYWLFSFDWIPSKEIGTVMLAYTLSVLIVIVLAVSSSFPPIFLLVAMIPIVVIPIISYAADIKRFFIQKKDSFVPQKVIVDSFSYHIGNMIEQNTVDQNGLEAWVNKHDKQNMLKKNKGAKALFFEKICFHRKFKSDPQAFKPFIAYYFDFLLQQEDKAFASRKARAYVNLIQTQRKELMPVLIEALRQLKKKERKILNLKLVRKQKNAVANQGDKNKEASKSNRSLG